MLRIHGLVVFICLLLISTITYAQSNAISNNITLEEINVYGYQQLISGKHEAALQTFVKTLDAADKSDPSYWHYIENAALASKMGENQMMALDYYSEAKKYAPQESHSYIEQEMAAIRTDMAKSKAMENLTMR